MPSKVVSVSDGGRLTVSDLVGSPMWIPTKQKELMTNQFISEGLFRNAGPNPNGIIGYREGDPMFLDDDVQDVAEGGEIPVSAGARGVPRTAFAVKRALGIRVTKEMIDENQVGEVQRQMTALKNTFVRADDRSAKALAQSPLVDTIAVTTAWDQTAGKPRTDIAKAIDRITSAAPTAPAAGSEDEYYGFEPDTMVVHPGLLATLMDNDNILKIYNGNIADQSIAYTGVFPGQLYGLSIIKSRTFPKDRILIMQRGVAGFYSDTRPLQFTGLYPEGNGPNGGPRESWRSDASHKRVMGLDQPKAAVWLTGVVAP